MNRRKYLNLAASVGCLACESLRNYDVPAVLHHPRAGQGIAQRASDYDVIALCPEHHTGTELSIHMTPVEFKLIFGTEAQLLDVMRERVADIDAEKVING